MRIHTAGIIYNRVATELARLCLCLSIPGYCTVAARRSNIVDEDLSTQGLNPKRHRRLIVLLASQVIKTDLRLLNSIFNFNCSFQEGNNLPRPIKKNWNEADPGRWLQNRLSVSLKLNSWTPAVRGQSFPSVPTDHMVSGASAAAVDFLFTILRPIMVLSLNLWDKISMPLISLRLCSPPLLLSTPLKEHNNFLWVLCRVTGWVVTFWLPACQHHSEDRARLQEVTAPGHGSRVVTKKGLTFIKPQIHGQQYSEYCPIIRLWSFLFTCKSDVLCLHNVSYSD